MATQIKTAKTVLPTYVAAKEAKNRFGELLDAVQRHPIIITKNNRAVAEIRRISEKTRFEEVEDEIWAKKLKKALKNPQYLGPEKSEEALRRMLQHAKTQTR